MNEKALKQKGRETLSDFTHIYITYPVAAVAATRPPNPGCTAIATIDFLSRLFAKMGVLRRPLRSHQVTFSHFLWLYMNKQAIYYPIEGLFLKFGEKMTILYTFTFC